MLRFDHFCHISIGLQIYHVLSSLHEVKEKNTKGPLSTRPYFSVKSEFKIIRIKFGIAKYENIVF
jgi:hypothetical protein